MGNKFQNIKGMEDLFERSEVSKWQYIEKTARNIFQHAGFEEIRTPIVEDAQLFERSVGASTDIVEKEMYTLFDRNQKKLALRPEGTASVVRSFVQHFTSHQIQEGRFYYMGPMFRYEKPQKGRLRQFHQIGLEYFGNDHPSIDAEIISLLDTLLDQLQIQQRTLYINSLGTQACRTRYIQALKDFLHQFHDEIGEEDRMRLERNPLRVLDSKNEKTLEILETAPLLHDFFSEESQKHFAAVRHALDKLQVEYHIQTKMVRGLDYYEKTVFEFVSQDLGAQNSIAGGGRYNHLVHELGGPPVSAFGFAVGMERLASLVNADQIATQILPRVFLAPLSAEAQDCLIQELTQLRSLPAQIIIDYENKSLKSKLKRAARWPADWVVIMGPEEYKQQTCILRNMKESQQSEIDLAQLSSALNQIIKA